MRFSGRICYRQSGVIRSIVPGAVVGLLIIQCALLSLSWGQFGPKRDDQYVTVSRTRWIDGINWRHSMQHACIVEQRGVIGVGQGKGAETVSIRRMDRSNPAGDIMSPNEQHKHIVNPIAMKAFRSRSARRVSSRFDTKLMDFGVPAYHIRHQRPENVPA